MKKVLVSDKLSSKGIDVVKRAAQVDVKIGLDEKELIKIIPNYDALLVRSQTKVTAKIIKAADNLKIIGRAGVGVDNIDLSAATQKGIIVVNSPEGNTVAAAEHSLAMLLAMSRNIPQAYESIRQGKWERSKFTGTECYGKTIGIIGLGKIGKRMATYANALGMKIIGYDPYVSKEYAEKSMVRLMKLDDVLKKADYLSFHIPKTKDTYHLIDRNKFKIMKNGVKIVNCARGGIIDENDLLEAVEMGKVAKAAVDVYEKEPIDPNHKFIKCDNIIITPHLGASTIEAQENVAIDVAEQVLDYFKGEQPRSAVNIPSLKPEIIEPVKKYMNLAEKVGLLGIQLVDGAIKKIEINYEGEIATKDISPLTTAVLKGLLGPIVDSGVNFVNAPLIAKERGMQVVESKKEESDFSNLVEIIIKTDKMKKVVSGSLFEHFGERLCRIDDYRVDAILDGYLLVVPNRDTPGIIGKVGTFLGSNKINIAGMDVGRDKIGGKAVMVINIDSPVKDKVLKDISKVKGILGQAKLVKI